jgi:hypothetical protein
MNRRIEFFQEKASVSLKQYSSTFASNRLPARSPAAESDSKTAMDQTRRIRPESRLQPT